MALCLSAGLKLSVFEVRGEPRRWSQPETIAARVLAAVPSRKLRRFNGFAIAKNSVWCLWASKDKAYACKLLHDMPLSYRLRANCCRRDHGVFIYRKQNV